MVLVAETMDEPEQSTEAPEGAVAEESPEPAPPAGEAKAEEETTDTTAPLAAEAVAADASSEAKLETKARATGGPLDAYEELARASRLSDIVGVAREVLRAAAEGRDRGPGFGIKVTSAAADAGLDRADAETPFGNALDVLGRGPIDDSERSLAQALWAHAVAESPRSRAEDEDALAEHILWLSTHTVFDAAPLLDRALGEDAEGLWEAIAALVRRIDQGRGGTLGRAEAIVGAAALAGAKAARARILSADVATHARDPVLMRLLSGGEGAALAELRLEGQLEAAPRRPVVTTLLALTGILLVVHAVRLLARVVLAYRRPAEISFSDAGVRLKTRTEMLGRVLREREQVLVRSGLVRVVREVRYPRLAFYAGLLALAIGSYVGVRAFVDGVRSASPSLLLAGLLFVIAGIAADFVLGTLVPGARGRCRLILVPRIGAAICVGDVDAERADQAVSRTLRAR